MARMSKRASFAARGGWWVAAQVPVLLLAILLPIWSSTGVVAGGIGYLVRGTGAILLIAGLGACVAGALALGPSLTPFPRPHVSSALVTRGIYGWVRHPIYSGLIALALGWALLWVSSIGLLYVVAVFLFFDRKAAREEAWLRERYPDYGTYAGRVRRFVPGIY